MIIKVCGMREPDNIRAVEATGIDWMGFIFYPKSPRYVSQISSRAGTIPDYSTLVKEERGEGRGERRPLRVGVFVDDMPQNIVTHVYNDALDIVQLHGSESPVMMDNLRRTLDPDIRPGVKLMKVLSVATPSDIDGWHAYEGHADYLLFDTRCPMKGGSGRQFDWSILSAYDGPIPFLLSGGIGPDDVERVKAFPHPQCIGIDLNSKFEVAPGVKDAEKLRQFIEALHKNIN